MILISVVICTYNRASLLTRCLFSLKHQTLNRDLFEVIIIDNNSTDNTQEIAKSWSEKNPNFRIIIETRQGLSHARNRGWKESQGKYIAFLDDDAVAEPAWLSEILSTFNSVKPIPDACGGCVELLWESLRPEWLSDSLLKPLGEFNYGPTAFFINERNINLSGSNVIFRKEVSDVIGHFDLSLGRQGTNLLSNDEIEFFQRMHDKKMVLYYNPRIIVKHRVTSERLTKQWHYDRSYWQGRSSAVMDFKNNSAVLHNLMKIGIKSVKLTYYSIHHYFCAEQQQENEKIIAFSCKGYLFQEFQNFFKAYIRE